MYWHKAFVNAPFKIQSNSYDQESLIIIFLTESI